MAKPFFPGLQLISGDVFFSCSFLDVGLLGKNVVELALYTSFFCRFFIHPVFVVTFCPCFQFARNGVWQQLVHHWLHHLDGALGVLSKWFQCLGDFRMQLGNLIERGFPSVNQSPIACGHIFFDDLFVELRVFDAVFRTFESAPCELGSRISVVFGIP